MYPETLRSPTLEQAEDEPVASFRWPQPSPKPQLGRNAPLALVNIRMNREDNFSYGQCDVLVGVGWVAGGLGESLPVAPQTSRTQTASRVVVQG